jgi:hypothetical protein
LIQAAIKRTREPPARSEDRSPRPHGSATCPCERRRWRGLPGSRRARVAVSAGVGEASSPVMSTPTDFFSFSFPFFQNFLFKILLLKLFCQDFQKLFSLFWSLKKFMYNFFLKFLQKKFKFSFLIFLFFFKNFLF